MTTSAAFSNLIVEETFESTNIEMTKIPDALVAWASAQGLSLKYVTVNPTHFVKYRVRGYRTLQWDEVPEAVRSEIKGYIEDPSRNGGELRLGDGIIAVTSQANEDRWHRIERQRGLQMLGQTSLADEQAAVSQINAAIPGNRRLIHLEEYPDTRTSPMEHVFGGTNPGVRSEFSAEQIEELKRRREEIPD